MNLPLKRRWYTTAWWYVRSWPVIALFLAILAFSVGAGLWVTHSQQVQAERTQYARQVSLDTATILRQLQPLVTKGNTQAQSFAHTLTALSRSTSPADSDRLVDVLRQAKTFLATTTSTTATRDGVVICRSSSVLSFVATGSGTIALHVNGLAITSGDHVSGKKFTVHATATGQNPSVVWSWSLVSGGPCG